MNRISLITLWVALAVGFVLWWSVAGFLTLPIWALPALGLRWATLRISPATANERLVGQRGLELGALLVAMSLAFALVLYLLGLRLKFFEWNLLGGMLLIVSLLLSYGGLAFVMLFTISAVLALVQGHCAPAGKPVS